MHFGRSFSRLLQDISKNYLVNAYTFTSSSSCLIHTAWCYYMKECIINNSVSDIKNIFISIQLRMWKWFYLNQDVTLQTSLTQKQVTIVLCCFIKPYSGISINCKNSTIYSYKYIDNVIPFRYDIINYFYTENCAEFHLMNICQSIDYNEKFSKGFCCLVNNYSYLQTYHGKLTIYIPPTMVL